MNCCHAMVNNSMLGHVTHHGQPRSVYKSHAECRFLEFWVKMATWPWRSRSMTLIFNISWENPKMHIWSKLGDSSSNPSQVIARTSQIPWNSEWKWPRWPWRSMSMTSIFNTSWEYPMKHVWCKFGDSSSNLCYGAGKVKHTDRITDGRTQATIPLLAVRSNLTEDIHLWCVSTGVTSILLAQFRF